MVKDILTNIHAMFGYIPSYKKSQRFTKKVHFRTHNSFIRQLIFLKISAKINPIVMNNFTPCQVLAKQNCFWVNVHVILQFDPYGLFSEMVASSKIPTYIHTQFCFNPSSSSEETIFKVGNGKFRKKIYFRTLNSFIHQ